MDDLENKHEEHVIFHGLMDDVDPDTDKQDLGQLREERKEFPILMSHHPLILNTTLHSLQPAKFQHSSTADVNLMAPSSSSAKPSILL
ncbi:hypothetical protein C0995_007080 [Termitomyces sp. Mi166|nr:hypothetical protein C0995_007080 [Termitomyces sp. Mi166\